MARYTLTPSLQKHLFHYRGKWVVTTYKHLIAYGDTSSEVYQAAKDLGFKKPILWRVPEANTAHFY